MLFGGVVLKAYILAIAGVILLSAVVSVLLPQGKMNGFIKGMAKLLVLAVIVTPFISYLQKGEFDFAANEINLDAAYLTESAALAATKTEEDIQIFLLEEYEIVAEASVTYSCGEYLPEKITVKISAFGIFGEEEHIDSIAKIKTVIEERYGCTAEVYEA